MAKIAQFVVDPDAGPVTLQLRAERAHPIQGVLSCRDAGHLDPVDVGDASIVQWQLPPRPALYVTYGVILPVKKVWFSPAYNRMLFQLGQMLSGSAANPRSFKTEEHAEGEWVGPPEAFRIVLQDGAS
jgi:hypothetical protein